MDLFTLSAISVGLSMDAFAVSVSNAACYPNARLKKFFFASLCFGVFQGLMPTIGFFAGLGFSTYIRKYDHWVALAVLGFIGAKTIIETIIEIRNPSLKQIKKDLNPKSIFMQAIATSIDALAVGVSFALTDDVNIWISAATISVITLAFSMIAHVIGRKLGDMFQEKAQIVGGSILILIGLKIFIDDVIL